MHRNIIFISIHISKDPDMTVPIEEYNLKFKYQMILT